MVNRVDPFIQARQEESDAAFSVRYDARVKELESFLTPFEMALFRLGDLVSLRATAIMTGVGFEKLSEIDSGIFQLSCVIQTMKSACVAIGHWPDDLPRTL